MRGGGRDAGRRRHRGARRQPAVVQLFDRQDAAYREAVLPKTVKARVSVEAGSPRGWERYAGVGGAMIGLDHFGASAPIKDLMNAFGFTAQHVVEAATAQIAQWKGT